MTDADLVIAADQLFDGEDLHERHAIAVAGDRITAVGPIADLRDHGPVRSLRGTLLPGFIDLHTHVHLDQTPRDVILRHGLTTVRDTGGPLVPPDGGDGRLRILGSGPILTAPGGYPVPVFGPQAALEIADADAAREAVRTLAAGGAAMIKLGLEPGGSGGAPWSAHPVTSAPPWPLLPLETLAAIVDEAHAHALTVSAHLSGPAGAELALAAGIDEWAHVPCDPLPDDLIEKAAASGTRVVGTLATLSRTAGLFSNAIRMAQAGIRLLYGTDLAHPDVPWGISAFELQLMLHTGAGSLAPTEVLAAATSRAGEHLGLSQLGGTQLGRLVPGAPADVIGTFGDALARFKLLEYPVLVMSGGVVVVDPR